MTFFKSNFFNKQLLLVLKDMPTNDFQIFKNSQSYSIISVLLVFFLIVPVKALVNCQMF